jgi:hypothetical protein
MQIPVTWDSANRKRDRSVSLRFTTNFEINNQDFSKMDEMVGLQGWLLFKENESIDLKELPTEAAPTDGKKPSQRLRGVLWHYWDKNTDRSEEFDAYYARSMERIIEQVKDKIHDLN